MPVEIVRTGAALGAVIVYDDGMRESLDLSPIAVLGSDLDRFLTPILADMNLQRADTIRTRLHHLKQLGEGFVSLGYHALPTARAEWQNVVLSIHHFVHTRLDRKQSLATRHLGVWAAARRVFSILAENGVMPSSVHLPPVQEALVLDEQPAPLLGDSPAQTASDVTQVDKLLLPISLARSDADYLDEVRDALILRRETLIDALKNYWATMRVNLEFGRRLRASLSESEVVKVVTEHSNGLSRPDPTGSMQGLAEYLVILEKLYDGCAYRYRGNTAAKRNLIYINRLPRIKMWPIVHSLPPNFTSMSPYSDSYAVWWWLGRISHRDVAVIVALLMMLHPSWTPRALFDAELCNRDGKTYLDLDEDGLSFEVEKHRAKAMKHESLCLLSEEILTTLVAHSAPLRERLKQEGNVLAGRLFLPYGRPNDPGSVSVSRTIPSLATGVLSGRTAAHGKTQWIGDLYPSLAEVGLDIGTITYKKIRATEGVLEWFRTKSLRAAAKKIGNSERVVIEHYIPKALLSAWNTRAVRRFQNMWIAVAAAGEDFLLDVTDFCNLSDLSNFVADILRLHAPESSPLAAELHLRFRASDTSNVDDRRGDLHVSLSEASLTALYRYHAAALASAQPREALEQLGFREGVSPAGLIQLADLLQLQLPQDRNPEYRRIHDYAMTQASEPTGLRSWIDLFSRHRHETSA